MIIVEENTTTAIKMYLRDDTLNDFDQYELVPIILEIISEDKRKQVFEGLPIAWTYDTFNKVLTFEFNSGVYDVGAFVSEEFYIVKIWEIREGAKVKLLSQDRMYIIPSGSDVATYQPKLATTEKTMDNEFKIYGE